MKNQSTQSDWEIFALLMIALLCFLVITLVNNSVAVHKFIGVKFGKVIQ